MSMLPDNKPADEPRVDQEPLESAEKSDFVWPDGKERKQFPVDEYLEEVADLLREHQVVVVEADTGAGKTTRLPQGLHLLLGEKIRVTQPRRNALRWNSKYVAQEMGCEVGETVGYKLAREEPKISSETQIVFQIDQSLCNEIVYNNGALPEGIIIVDEAHERSIPLDLLLAMIKKKLPESPNTKIVIASATLNADKFREYFAASSSISIPGRMFPVKTREPYRLGKFEHHTQGAISAARSIIDEFFTTGISVPTEDNQGEQLMSSGTVLMYLPGKEDIDNALANLRQYANDHNVNERIEILSCHGETPPQEQDQVQRPVRDGTLRIVCGTEILRTGITCPQVIGSIDSMQVKRLISNNGVGHLKKISISRAQAVQGMGRSGRTGPGFYQPISFEREFEQLEPHPKPSILIEPIAGLILQISALNESIRTLDLLDKPKEEAINYAIERLQHIGALDEDERITDIGEKLLRFPLSPERGCSLLVAAEYGVLAESVIANAIIEQEGIFDRQFIPENTKGVERVPISSELAQSLLARFRLEINEGWIEEDEGTYFINFTHPKYPRSKEDGQTITSHARGVWAKNDRSDFTALVNAYREFKKIERELREMGRVEDMSRRSQEDRLRAWAGVLGINYKRLMFAEESIKEIIDELRGAGLITNSRAWFDEYYRKMEQPFSDTDKGLVKSLIIGALDGVAVQSSGSSYRSRQVEEGLLLASESAANESDSLLMLTSGIRKIEARKTITLAFLAAPITIEHLQEVVPHMITYKPLKHTAYYDPEHDKAMVNREVVFNKIKLGVDEVELTDKEEATKALAWWLVKIAINLYSEKKLDNDQLDIISQHNREVFKRYSELNHRANEKVFPLGDQSNLEAWFKEKLAGATSLSEITDLEAIKLPQVDQELEHKVLIENPDRLKIGSREYELDYSWNIVTLKFDSQEVGDWLSLPDEGLKLPNGRDVTLDLSVGVKMSYGVSQVRIGTSTDIKKLKIAATEYVDTVAWDRAKEDLKDFCLPDLTYAELPKELPTIAEQQYGVSMVDGSELIAYGCYRRVNGQNGIAFAFSWFRHRSEAEAVYNETVYYIKEYRQRKEREEVFSLTSEIYDDLYRSYGTEITTQLADQIKSHTSKYFEIYQDLDRAKEWLVVAEQLKQQMADEQQLRLEKENLRPLTERNIKELLRTCPVCGGSVDNFDPNFFTEPTTYHLCRPGPRLTEAIRSLGDEDEATNLIIQKRYAKVITECCIGDHVVGRIAAFFKFGHWNFHYVPNNYIPSDEKPYLRQVLTIMTEEEIKKRDEESAREHYQENLQQMLEDERAKKVIRLKFTKGKNPKTGEVQYECGGKAGRYIVDRNFNSLDIEEGAEYFCRVRRVIVDTPGFKLTAVTPMMKIMPESDNNQQNSGGTKEETPSDDVLSIEDLRARFQRKR